jgi:hypothetical protein
MTMKHLFVSSLLLTVCFSCSNKIPVLKFDPVLDSVYHYILETGLTQMQSNTSDTMWNSITIHFSLQCLQKEDSLRTMKLVFEGLKVMAPAMETTASKDTSLNPMHHSLYRALVSDSVFVLMDKQGQVVQVKGIEALVDRVVHKTQVEKSMANSSLRTFASPEAIRDMLNQVFFFMPNKEISTGDDWVKNFVLTSQAPLKYSNRVIVGRIRRDSVMLDIISTISPKTGEGGSLYEQGKQTGRMIVDSSGMVWSYAAESATEYKTDSYTVAKNQLFKVRRRKH